MRNIQCTFLLLLAIFGVIRAFSIPARKCRRDIKPIKISMDGIAKVHKWKILYATEVYKGIDSEYRESLISGQDQYYLIDTRKLTTGSTDTETYSLETIDNVLYENSLDGKGGRERFQDIVLAVTSDGGILYYRCSKFGRADVDTRIIACPSNATLSNFSIRELQTIDQMYGFQGELIKLPYSIGA